MMPTRLWPVILEPRVASEHRLPQFFGSARSPDSFPISICRYPTGGTTLCCCVAGLPAKRERLPFLDQENMHRPVGQDDKNNTKDGEVNDIGPQGIVVKAEGAEDCGSGTEMSRPYLWSVSVRYLTSLTMRGLKGVVEDGEPLQPDGRVWDLVVVEEETRKEQAEQHDQSCR